MLIRNRIRKVLLLVSALALLSLLAGRFIIAPYTGMKPDIADEFALGLLFLMAVAEMFNITVGIVFNRISKTKIEVTFPKDVDAIKSIGVKTPLDYSCIMCDTLYYHRFPVAHTLEASRPFVQVSSLKLLNKSIDMFEEMFGRRPECCETLDWEYILNAEASGLTGKNVEEISMEDITANLSPKVLDMFRNSKKNRREDRAV